VDDGMPGTGGIRRATLDRLLSEARDLGFLGPGPVEVQLEHARAFAEAVEAALAPSAPRAVVDLGSGGGVPGLVLASRWEAASFLFVEARARRAAFLLRAVAELGMGGRVTVEAARAEVVGRTPSRRGGFDVATARGFGRPAAVAECAAPFLEVGGVLVVSEPPNSVGAGARWPEAGLAELGMGGPHPVGSGYRFVAVSQVEPCPPRFPRRVGVPAKRPLF
jgi:16S rRNA (guanine527-N7)-methyltransferase